MCELYETRSGTGTGTSFSRNNIGLINPKARQRLSSIVPSSAEFSPRFFSETISEALWPCRTRPWGQPLGRPRWRRRVRRAPDSCQGRCFRRCRLSGMTRAPLTSADCQSSDWTRPPPQSQGCPGICFVSAWPGKWWWLLRLGLGDTFCSCYRRLLVVNWMFLIATLGKNWFYYIVAGYL